MSDKIKIGPLWDRTVFDPSSRVIKYRMKRVRWDDVRRLRVREIITRLEEEQLLNVHPEVQKDRRPAELWVDLKDGGSVRAGEAEAAGLLLEELADVSRQMGVPIESERSLIAEAETKQAAPKST